MPKKVREFSLISQEDTMKTLMSKWVIQALLAGKSNLLEVPHHVITTFSPWSMGLPYGCFPTMFYKGWIPNLAPHHPIVEAMAKTIAYLSPTIP